MNFLLLLLSVNFVTTLFLLFSQDWRLSKMVSLVSSFVQLTLFVVLWLNFDFSSGYLQYNLFFTPFSEFVFPIHLAVDGLGLYFIFLTVLLLPICILCSWSTVTVRVIEFQLLLHVIALLLILVFFCAGFATVLYSFRGDTDPNVLYCWYLGVS